MPTTFTSQRLTWGALLAGGAGLLVGALVIWLVPQRPDGDATALANFNARNTAMLLHTVRHAFWWNLAGALLAWGLLARLFESAERCLWESGSDLFLTLSWLALLLFWGGWAWNQTRGWQGELFLEPGVPTALGVDRSPTIEFSHFLLPPAPDGPGRALALRLQVDGQPQEIAEERPYQAAGWTLRPRWYGVTVRSPQLSSPLFFGASGEQLTTSRAGERVRVTVDTETLEVVTEPYIAEVRATHHAIVRARFAPGRPLQAAAIWLGALGVLLTLATHKYNARKERKRPHFSE